MRGRIILLAAFLMTGALAGCIGDDGEGEDLEEAGQTPEAGNGTAEANIQTETLEGAVDFGIATPVMSFNSDSPATSGSFIFELDRDSDATGYVFALTWNASTPASENLDLWVRDSSEGNIPPSDPTDPIPAGPVATATGSSPLELVVSEDDLSEDTDYSVIVRAPSDMGVGLAVNQPFDLRIDTYIGEPLPS